MCVVYYDSVCDKHAIDNPSADAFTCQQYPAKQFMSTKALASHCLVVHGARTCVAQCVDTDGICPVCQ
jgi:hypothetical protein